MEAKNDEQGQAQVAQCSVWQLKGTPEKEQLFHNQCKQYWQSPWFYFRLNCRFR